MSLHYMKICSLINKKASQINNLMIENKFSLYIMAYEFKNKTSSN